MNRKNQEICHSMLPTWDGHNHFMRFKEHDVANVFRKFIAEKKQFVLNSARTLWKLYTWLTYIICAILSHANVIMTVYLAATCELISRHKYESTIVTAMAISQRKTFQSNSNIPLITWVWMRCRKWARVMYSLANVHLMKSHCTFPELSMWLAVYCAFYRFDNARFYPYPACLQFQWSTFEWFG